VWSHVAPGPAPRRRTTRPRSVVAAVVTLPHTLRAGRLRAVLLQLVVFAGVGGLLNVVYGLLYVALRAAMDAQWANAVSLIVSTVLGTWVHRRFTFGVRSNAHTLGHQVLGLVLLGLSLVVTAGSLWLLDHSVEDPSRADELLVLAAANLGVGLVRFAAFRGAMVPADGRTGA
jgi:putative flippase GtrA